MLSKSQEWFTVVWREESDARSSCIAVQTLLQPAARFPEGFSKAPELYLSVTPSAGWRYHTCP